MRFCKFLLLLILQSTELSVVADLVWSDEFESDSLNTGYWNYVTGGAGWGNFELQEYTDNVANVGVSGGSLNITAIREEGTYFTSGRINTTGKVLFKYGSLEARIKVPNVTAGLWPAFWTMGENFDAVGWPAAGEMDIMEIGQGLAINAGVGNQRVIGGAHWENNGNYATYATWHDFDTPLNLDYHTYKLDWTPTEIVTTVDGTEVFRMDISDSSCTDCEEFHRPHYIVLNLAVGGLFTSTGSGASSSGSSSSSSSGSSSSSSSGSSSSSSSGSSSSSAGCGSSSSVRSSDTAGSSSSGGCSVIARTDVSATLPAHMLVDYVRIYSNQYTYISVPTDETFWKTETTRPTPLPTALPGPTSEPANVNDNIFTFGPTPAPQPSFSATGTSEPTESYPYYSGGTSYGSGQSASGSTSSRSSKKSSKKSSKSSGGRSSSATTSTSSSLLVACSANYNYHQTLLSITLILFISLTTSTCALFCS